MQILVSSVRLLLILYCCISCVFFFFFVYKPDDFLITKPSWMDVSNEEYNFAGVGVADNVGNIGDILQSAQNNAINKSSRLKDMTLN